LDAALVAYLSEITERVIREEVHGETGDAEEIDEPLKIGRCPWRGAQYSSDFYSSLGPPSRSPRKTV
jgi:hypothetical protein